MIKIHNDATIEYTKGDTFRLKVSPKTSFNDGSKLRFIVAKDETSSAIIDNTVSLSSDGTFSLGLYESQRSLFEMGGYIYKLILITLDGTVITQKSGDFIVKWGA